MSAPIAKTQFTFELPKLSYVDTSWEEKVVTDAAQAERARPGLAHWLAGRVAAFRAWREQVAAAAELASMTDRELADIGLNRGDVGRVLTLEAREGLAGRSA